jgi:hypothetical protein
MARPKCGILGFTVIAPRGVIFVSGLSSLGTKHHEGYKLVFIVKLQGQAPNASM